MWVLHFSDSITPDILLKIIIFMKNWKHHTVFTFLDAKKLLVKVRTPHFLSVYSATMLNFWQLSLSSSTHPHHHPTDPWRRPYPQSSRRHMARLPQCSMAPPAMSSPRVSLHSRSWNRHSSSPTQLPSPPCLPPSQTMLLRSLAMLRLMLMSE